MLAGMKRLSIIAVLLFGGCATTTIDVYFSPRGGAEAAIVSEVQKAECSLYVMAYGFANDDIIDALVEANASGKRLFLVLDRTNKNSPKLQKIRKSGGEIKIDARHRIMHDKVIIIDGKTVITGSYNFSKNAELYNSENLLIIRSPELVEKYERHFWDWSPIRSKRFFNSADNGVKIWHIIQ